MSKNNVHPDYYKTAGRDRQDDAAAARQARAMSTKATSRERPDRMAKGFYFQRPEPPQTLPAARRTTSKASATQSKKKSSVPRTQRKPTSSTRTTGRSAKKNVAVARGKESTRKR